MFTRFMISKAFRGFSRRAIRIFSRSVIGVPCVGIGDGTRCAEGLQRVRSLDALRFGSRAAVVDRRMAQPFYPQLRKYPCVPALTRRARSETQSGSPAHRADSVSHSGKCNELGGLKDSLADYQC